MFRWHDAYYILLLLERVAAQAPAALEWPLSSASMGGDDDDEEGGEGQVPSGSGAIWEQVLRLLLHRSGI